MPGPATTGPGTDGLALPAMSRSRPTQRTFAATLWLLVGLGTGCGAIGEGLETQAMPVGSQSEARLASGPYEFESADFRLVDGSRPSMGNGDFAGTDERVLEVTVWSPVGRDDGAPLLVYGHGFTGNRREMIFLLEHLASHGYIVAGLDFPLTTGAAPGGPNVADLSSQPGDMRFVLDALLSGEGALARFAEDIDPERIAFAGLSYGGLTTTLLAFHPREADPRIKAAVSIAGPTQMFSAAYFARGGPPFLMIAGTEDAMVPFELNAAPVPALVAGAGLVTIAGGTHLGFVDFARTAFRFSHNSDATACAGISRFADAETDPEHDPFALLGGPESGIDFEAWVLPCQAGGEFGLAIRPERQQAITSLAARAFLDSLFAEEPAARAEADRYLRETLPHELPGADYTTSP